MAEELNSSSEQSPKTGETARTGTTPTVAAQPAPKKPIKTIWIAAYGLIGLAALGLISNVANLHSRFTTHLPKSAYGAKPTTVGPEAVTSFQQQEQEQIRKLEQENAEAQRAAQRAAEAAEAVGNQTAPTLLPCTPALAGTQGTSSTGSPIVCGSDGQWHPSAEATGIPTMTAAQKHALYGRDTGGSARDDAAQIAKQRRLDALNSSSVAVDFTKATATKEHEGTTNEPQANLVPVNVDPGQVPRPNEPIDRAASAEQPDSKKVKYDWDHYAGKLYRIFEGTVLETVLTNRINGAFAGPIDTMLTTDLWSHDHQQLLMPQGTRCLGTVSAVNGTGQRVDSSVLLPSVIGCLMKNVTRPCEWDGRQIEEATERDDETGTD